MKYIVHENNEIKVSSGLSFPFRDAKIVGSIYKPFTKFRVLNLAKTLGYYGFQILVNPHVILEKNLEY